MRLRSLLVATFVSLGLGTLALACLPPSDAQFPNAGRGHVAFSPDGTSVFVLLPSGSLVAYELG
jgi:hypothetical protein